MIHFLIFQILAYLVIGWLTVPIKILILPDYYSEEIRITIGDLFKFTELDWWLIVLFWPILWLIILIELCRKLSECDIVIFRKRK